MACEKCKDAPALGGETRCGFCKDDTFVGDERRSNKKYALGMIQNELEWAVKNITSPLITQEYRDVYKEKIAQALKQLDEIPANNE